MRDVVRRSVPRRGWAGAGDLPSRAHLDQGRLRPPARVLWLRSRRGAAASQWRGWLAKSRCRRAEHFARSFSLTIGDIGGDPPGPGAA